MVTWLNKFIWRSWKSLDSTKKRICLQVEEELVQFKTSSQAMVHEVWFYYESARLQEDIFWQSYFCAKSMMLTLLSFWFMFMTCLLWVIILEGVKSWIKICIILFLWKTWDKKDRFLAWTNLRLSVQLYLCTSNWVLSVISRN